MTRKERGGRELPRSPRSAANPAASHPHPDTMAGASKGWCALHDRPLIRCVRILEAELKEAQR